MNKPVKPGTTIVGPGGHNLVDDITVPGDEHFGRFWKPGDVAPTWSQVPEEVPADGQAYMRQKGVWVLAVAGGKSVTEIVPTMASVGLSVALPANVYGNGFIDGDVVMWDGVALATAYISPNQLGITIDTTLGVAPSVANVTVAGATGAVGFHFVSVTGVDYGLGLKLDPGADVGDPPIVNLTPAGTLPQFLGGVYVPTRDATQAADVDTSGGDGKLVVLTATNTLLGGILEPPLDGMPYDRQWNETAQVWEWVPAGAGADFGIGLSLDQASSPPVVHLQPAGDSPATLGGVYVIDRVRNVEEGLELGIDGRLRVPLATDNLAGAIVEPPPDDKGYVRRRDLSGVSAWVPPADTVTDFGTGLSKDETATPPIVHLQPAADSPAGLGGVYVIDRERNVSEGLELGLDGRLRAPLATPRLAGTIVEPEDDGKGYVRTTLNGVSQWVPPADTPTEYGTGLQYDETQVPPIVHLQMATDFSLGGIFEPVQDGLAYSRQFDSLAQVWKWVPALTAGLQITSIIPDKAIYGPGEPLLTVQVNGSEFTPTTVVHVDDVPTATTYVSPTVLTFVMNPAVPITESFHIITVHDPAAVPPALVDGLGAEQFDFIKASTEVDYGTGLQFDTAPTPPIVHVTPAGIAANLLGGVWVPPRDHQQAATVETGDGMLVVPLATPFLAGSIIEPPQDDKGYVRRTDINTGIGAWVPPASTPGYDYGLGLAVDRTPVPPDQPIVNLTPAGDAPNFLGGVYVVDRERNNTEGLELGIDGRLRVPLATNALAGAIVEPPPDDKGYVRRRDLNGVSAWVPPSDTLTDFGTGLYKDETQTPVIVHLQPAGDSPTFLGGVYVIDRERNVEEGLELGLDGRLRVPLATDNLAGAIVEPPDDAKGYVRRRENGVSAWVPPSDTLTDYGTGLYKDETATPAIVHLQPAGDSTATLGGVYVVDRERNVEEGLELGLDGRLRAPLATPRLAGTIVEPEDDGKGYVRTTQGGISMWVPPATTPYHFVIGLTHDDATGDVNLLPAGDSSATLGGIYVVDRARSDRSGLELSLDGELKAPPATNLLVGTLTEPPQDGLAYSRQWDVTLAAWVWVPALTAGLQITGLIPDKAILGPTEPIVTVHAYGSSFTPTTVVVIDGTDASATTVISETELTFQMNPAVPLDEQTYIVTVRDTATSEVGLGAESFEFIKSSTSVEYGIGLTLDTTTTPDPTVNLQVANANGGEIGGVKLIGRGPTQGLEYDIATGTLWAPLATDVAAGSIVEPPPDGSQYVRTRDQAGFSEWIKSTASGVIIADAPPDVAMTPPGTLWWESDSGDLFIMYDDGTSKQWVEAVAGADPGVQTHIGDAPPATANVGDLWWDSDAGTLAIYYQDADTTQWVQIAGPQPAPPAGGITDAPSDGTPYNRQDAAWVAAGAGGGIADAPADGTEYLRKDNAWVNPTAASGAFLPLAGGTMTGHMTINYTSPIGPGDPQGSAIYLNKVISSQQPAVVFGGVAGVQRWKVNITGDFPSVGADNFQIVSTNDGGGGAVVMEIARATGDMVYGGNMTVYGTVTETLLMDAAAADPDLPGNSMGALLLHALAEIKSLKAEIAYIKANCCP